MNQDPEVCSHCDVVREDRHDKDPAFKLGHASTLGDLPGRICPGKWISVADWRRIGQKHVDARCPR